MLKYTELSKYYSDKLNDYGGDLRCAPAEPFNKGVEIISYESDGLNQIIAHLLKRHNFGGTFKQRYHEVKKMTFDDKMDILRRVTDGRGSHDEWVEMDEDFDLVKLTYEVRTDIGATRDWRRHQKWDRGEPLYNVDNGFHRPYMLKDMSVEAGKIFDSSMELAGKAQRLIRRDFLHQSQYVVPMATMHTITFSGGLDQLQYKLWTRSTPQGNFSYRQDTFNIAEAAIKLYPWLLGYKEYPKERSFIDVYKEAPLKNVLRLQLGETELHQ